VVILWNVVADAETDEGFVKLFCQVGVSAAVASGSDDEDQESSLNATHVFSGLRNLLKVGQIWRKELLLIHCIGSM